jgi:ubiquinone/menaquinone biosynthesis C-methylase UbiE
MRPGTLLRWYALQYILKDEIKDDGIILDIGSYDGEISYRLKKISPNLNITVLDVDQSGLEIANKKGLNTLCCSALKIPIENEQVDIIICLDVIEHIVEDHILVKEISRVLKTNGKVILTTPMKNGVNFPFVNKQKVLNINKKWGHVRLGYSIEDLENLFQKNNLSIVKKTKYFNFFSRFFYYLSFCSNIPLKGKKFLYEIVIKLEPFLKLKSQEHIIIAQKMKS